MGAPFRLIVAVVLVSGICVGLGVWQVARLAESRRLAETWQAQQQQEPRAVLPAADASPDTWLYRPVQLRGHFLPQETVKLGLRQVGFRPGHLLIVPFAVEHGPTVLVNHGWVPATEWFPEADNEIVALGHGATTLVGVLVPPERQKPFAPANQPQDGMWYWLDAAALYKHAQLPALPYLVQQTYRKVDGVYPYPWPLEITARSDHLYYAITWFALAAGCVMMFLLYTLVTRRSLQGC